MEKSGGHITLPDRGQIGASRAVSDVSRGKAGGCCSSVKAVDIPLPPTPDAALFRRTVEHVQSYVRSEPGAYSGLVTAAQEDPVGTTMSLVALGAVLLDIAAGAFSLTPDEMLDKVSAGIAQHADSSV